MDWAQERALEDHGWRKSQCCTSWLRELRSENQTDIRGEPYLPKYAREVAQLRRKSSKAKEQFANGVISEHEYDSIMAGLVPLRKDYL